MKNNISIKTQSKRATSYQIDKAINVNLIYGGFQIGIAASGQWGNFKEEKPVVEISINGEEYAIPLEKFKEFITTNFRALY